MSENLQINWKTNLFFTWLSQLLSMAGFAMAMPFIPIFIRERFGVNDPQLCGWYVAVFYCFGMLSFAVFTPLWGILADRYGRKLMLLRANFGAGIMFPLMAFAPNIWMLFVLRFVASMFSGTVNAAQTLIVSTTPEKHSGLALGLLCSAVWSGNMLGYLSGGLLADLCGYTVTFIVSGVMFAVGGLLVLVFVKEDFVPPVRDVAAKTGRKTIHLPDFSVTIWVVVGLFALVAFARRFDEPYLALLVEHVNGFDRAAFWTGVISAVAAAGGIITGLVIGGLCDRFSPVAVAVPAVILGGMAMLAQGYAPDLTTLAVARFVLFFMAGGLEPVFLTMLSRVSAADKKGEVFGWSATSRTIGMLIASMLGGEVIYYLGLRSVYITGTIGFILLIPAVLYAANRVKRNNISTQKREIVK
ncbi:MAG: MFS transporter [Victivallaceae bacterium]|nr:MFS transporter [Victivallaceae bacterium]